MDPLQYHILLEEADIYTKKRIDKEEVDSCDSEYVYRDNSDNTLYQIIPNEMSTEEIKTALLARQVTLLNSLYKKISIITAIFVISIVIPVVLLVLQLL